MFHLEKLSHRSWKKYRELKTREDLNKILAHHSGQTIEQIAIDTERDNFMTAEAAKAYGLIDEVITRKSL